MNRILIDTNVVLDVLLDRRPHVEASAAVWAAVETGVAEGMLPAHAVTTILNLAQREMGQAKAMRVVRSILKVFGVAAVDSRVIHEALELSFADFEDAVMAAAAQMSKCKCVVTRNPKGFRRSPVPALTPEGALALFAHTS